MSSAKRLTWQEGVDLIADLLRKDPAMTRQEAAVALGRGYAMVSRRWDAACRAAGVPNVKAPSKRGPRRELVGERFGHLLVVEDLGTDDLGKRMWRCECDCGAEVERSTHALTSGQSTQCAKWDHDAIGKTYHALTVLGYAGEADGGDALYRCRCECGNEVIAIGNDLKRGKVKSCGCWRDGRDYVDGTKLSGLDAGLRRDSPSGVTGVTPHRGGWRAQITLSGVVYHIGEYRSFERAVAARREAEELLYDPVLIEHGHAPTDEAAWREQVEEALKTVREKHRRAEREAREGR